MTPLEVGAAGFVVLFALIAGRMPIGLALLLVGLGGLATLHGFDTTLFVLGSAPVETLSRFTLSVLPLFLLMGSFAVRSGLSEGLYRAANGFVGQWPGGLTMASIIACGGFGAVCGSSLATVSTMAKIAVPEMLRYNYSPKLAAGSIAAWGTLGILIPPSLLMIVYAFLTETSVGRLFAAGIVPGVVSVLLYLATIAIWTRLNPEIGPAGERTPWHARWVLLKDVWGVVVLFGLVMGGIFAGLFSPTEGGAVGAFGALIIGLVKRRIDLRVFILSVRETVQLSAMIFFIVVGVSVFDFFMQA